MLSRRKIAAATVAVLLAAALGAQGYERELNSLSLREAYFLGKNASRSATFARDYAQTFPVPKTGVHIERIEVSTPFKQMVDRARLAADGYSPVTAEADYERAAPLPVTVRVRLQLTPSYPAHSPYTLPVVVGPIYTRDANFWQAFVIRLEQRGQLEPRRVAGQPLYNCGDFGPCWLTGAEVELEFDSGAVASSRARVLVLSPDGQRVEAEFDLGRLR